MSWSAGLGRRQWVSMSLIEWLLFGWLLLAGWAMWQTLYWTFWLTWMLCLWTFRGPYLGIRWFVRVTKASQVSAGRQP